MIWGGKKKLPKSPGLRTACSHALMDLIGHLDVRKALRGPP